MSGQLDQVLVKNGEPVKEGEVLLLFDVKAAKVQEATLNQQLKLEDKRLKDQLRSNKRRQETLKQLLSPRGSLKN